MNLIILNFIVINFVEIYSICSMFLNIFLILVDDFLNFFINYSYCVESSGEYSKEYYDNNPILQKNNEILKVVINNYILENYFVFGNSNDSIIFNGNFLKEILSFIFYNLEGFFIGIQKFIYEYINYFVDLIRWYIDYKILLNKAIVNSNVVTDLYYNISLELLMDINNANIKSLFYILETDYRLWEGQDIEKNVFVLYDQDYIILLKNYFQVFNESPYKVCVELLNLYKQYPVSNVLSYGIDYDVNVIKNNKYLFSFFETDITNKNKLNKLNIYHDLYNGVENYKISTLRFIDKDQNYFKNFMFWDLNVKHNLYVDNDDFDITSKYNKLFLDIFENSYKWGTKNTYIGGNAKFSNYPEFYHMFGGYSYWWGWHQDAVYIHGKKGPGGAALWDDYIKWKMSTKLKVIVTYKPKHIKRIKHGVYLYNYYPGKINKKWKIFDFDWDYKKKRKLRKFLIHGRRVWEIEKLFFKNFLLSDDLWIKKLYSFGGSPYHYENIELNQHKYKFDLESERRHEHERLMYVRFGFNSPAKIIKKKRKLLEYWFSVVNDNDDWIKKPYGWRKDRMYEYFFSILEYYYTLSSKIHQESMKGVRGFIMNQFAINFWMKKDRILIWNYVNNAKCTWETFYTNIESVTEPLNLNYINKNISSRHFYERMDKLLMSKKDLWSNVNLPKKSNLLLKKAYIENLIYVYQREEDPMIEYIKYRNIQLIFWNIYEDILKILKGISIDIIEAYDILGGELKREIGIELLKIKQIRFLIKYHEIYKENYKYLWVLVYFFIYSLVCSLLIVFIKSFLPRNLIYGIKTKDKPKWYQAVWFLLDTIKGKDGRNISTGYMQYIYEHYNKMAAILKLDSARIAFIKTLHRKIKNDNNDININKNTLNEDILKKGLRSVRKDDIYLKKNFFDKEHQFIYSWDNRIDKTFNHDFGKVRTFNKLDSKKNKNLLKNYDVYYKTLNFEKNLEKWENNTKIRADILLWAEFSSLLKGLFLYYRDRRFNHNRTLFWEDYTLDKESKTTYYFVMPKLFFNMFFIVRFSIGALRLWDFKYWQKRWSQWVLYGTHARVSYKDLKGRLEKEWTLEWYRDQADYGAAMFYKDYAKIVEKFEMIKITSKDRDALRAREKRAEVLENILRLTFDESRLMPIRTYIESMHKIDEERLVNIRTYIESMHKIDEERLVNNFDFKFQDIKKRLILDVGKITAKQWAEQTLMLEYYDIVFQEKLAIEKDEYDVLKQSFTQRVRRDYDDDEKTLVMLDWEHEKYIKSIMDTKIAAVYYEKQLREFNFKNKIIDPALDRKERVFFEKIIDYKKDLQLAYEDLADKEKEIRLLDSDYERKSRKLYSILETHYLWYRWFSTMGSRLNFLLSLILGIFVGWFENIAKVRKNEYSVESLLKIMFTDFSEFVYKMYWEYLIICKKYKTLTKFGVNILDILTFSLILTPILLYTGSLYLVLVIYLCINKILKKNFNIFKGNVILGYVTYYLKNILNSIILIFNIFFRDLKTGNTIFDLFYIKFYIFCGWIQRNFFYIKGAFILGYREKGIFNGIKKIFYLFNLKYKAYLENLRNKRKFYIIYEIKKMYKSRIDNFMVKMQILLTITNIKYSFIRMHWTFVRFFYISIIQPIFKIDSHNFYKIYSQNIVLLTRYYNQQIDSLFLLINLFRKITIFEFLTLFIKKIFMLIILPFKFLINHQRWKYINNYKKGIQGFRDNPMYKLLNNPKHHRDWRVKLHEVLMDNVISQKLQEIKLSKESLLEIFLIYKIDEVKWANKNTFQEHFWRTLYWDFRKLKESILTYLISFMKEIEEGYKTFELSIETQNWSFYERIKYAYYVNRFEKDVNNRSEQKKISRDLFFYRKARDRRKLMRSYFIKGIINFITYSLINKVIFTKINDIKIKRKKRFKYRYIKHKTLNVNKTIHLTEHLLKVPPQFWSLVILYDSYFKYLLRYKFETLKYPQDWKDHLEHSKDYKWRLAAHEHNYDIPFFNRRKIGIDMNSYHFDSFAKNLATAPFDPMLRWALFLLEYGFSAEDITFDGEEVWGDVSLTHLLTYNKRLDAYQYEIRDYNRLLKGLSWFRMAETSLKKDKEDHYKKRYDLVSNNIILKNKNVLEKVVARRRSKAAKILHKALLRNKALRTQEEKDAALNEERNKDYFYFKKKEFFDNLEIQHYFDWEEEVAFDSKIVEDKYFGTLDMENVTFDAKLYEDFHNAHGLPVPLTYLAENIVLKSFDQTLEEIFHFLKFTVWKIMSNNKQNKKTSISYKNLYIKPSFFKRINYLEYKKRNTKIDKETGETLYYYEYPYKGLEWESTKYEPMYGFIENNYFTIYLETGALYTYQDKIKFNDYAKPFYKPEELFHGNETLLRWSKRIRNRRLGFKDIKNIAWKSKKRKKKRMCLTIAYINNIKWTWEQWLGYGDVEKESEILNKNIIILNEKYRLWNLKRAPMRLKLPIALDVKDEAYDFFKEKGNYASRVDHTYFLLSSSINPWVEQSLTWWECKNDLERIFNKNITDIVFWIFRAGGFDPAVRKIRKDFAYVLKNFERNFNVFNKIYFMGMQSYSWDLMRYHEVWIGEDEFPFHQYYALKQMEFINHDPAIARIVEQVHNLGIDKYRPGNYVYFFKYQYNSKIWYNLYGLLSIGNFIWFFKVLFYNPGEYIASYYMLMVPLFLGVAFWFLRRHLLDPREVSDGAELYLYRHHTSIARSKNEWGILRLAEWKLAREEIVAFYDVERRKKVFGSENPDVDVERSESWWRHHTHLNSKNVNYTYKHMRYFTMVLGAYIWAQYWTTQQFRYRNHWCLWEFYKEEEQMYIALLQQEAVGPTNYKERMWFEDSFLRLESGGNIYSKWYQNLYRRRSGREAVELDYGHDWQKVKDLDITMYYDTNTIIHLPSSYSDASWIDLCRYLTIYIPQDIKENRRWTKYKLYKKHLKFKDYLNYANKVDYNDNDVEFKKVTDWYLEGGLNLFQHLYYGVKNHIKEALIEEILGKKYTQNYNPLKEWFDFQKLIKDVYGYDLTSNSFTNFLFEAKARTRLLIHQDFERYRLKKNNNVVDTVLLEKNEILAIKDKSFMTGDALDLKSLLSISENEKHLHIIYHNFVKYKLKRLDLLLNSDNWQLINVSKNLETVDIIEHNKKIQEILEHKLDVELYSKQCEQYVRNILKNISYEDKLEYKYNLLLNLWSEKKWSWGLIKDIFFDLNISEILDIIIKIFINIL